MPRHELPPARRRIVGSTCPAAARSQSRTGRAGLGLVLAGGLVLSACGSQQAPSEGTTTSSAASDGASAAGTSESSARSDYGSGEQAAGVLSDEQTRAAAEEAVSEMTLEEKAGQVLLATWSGADPASVDAQISQIGDLHLGGVIIMGANVPTAEGQGTTEEAGAGGGASNVDVEAMRSQNDRVGAALSPEERSWSGIIGVDQEGGSVARLAEPLTVWPSAQTVGAADDPELTREAAAGMGAELAGLGFTMDFAPVADVTSPDDAVVQDRAYSDDPQIVSEQTVAAMSGLSDAGLISSPKHFPGHGSVSTDSHVGLPVQQTPVDTLKDEDWAPFRAAVDAGAPTIMMGHIAVSDWNDQVPATLEPKAYQALREDLGFQGAVVTDALDMGALKDVVGPGRPVDSGVTTPAGAALQAGADLLVMPEDEAAAHADIVQAVESGAIPQQRLDEAAIRVVAMQMSYDQTQGSAQVEPAEPGSHQELAARFDG
ncbi:glycoside hydrolase family 3 N-terminal domain-containing protein [Kocuria palustris]|uniref:glycoside hydrolase family 3 N-terminal domain-containing protein n=1 Tax=Kocuria palustris TaxID=71999 RepID=UPI0023001691|nr:glycoside hydrolase family 3 N-terminal domain-containing protein [Kocuria palustris]